MRAVHSKGTVTYQFRGDLKTEISKCEKELEKLQNSSERAFIIWQYDKAKKERDSYERRINDLKNFIRLARQKIENKEVEE